MVAYYSFVFYCMVMFSFIACIIVLCKAFGGVILEVQTYINSKREVEAVSYTHLGFIICQKIMRAVGLKGVKR